MEEIARRLAASGARSFFVARLKEGVALRRLLPGARIFAFDGLKRDSAPSFAAHRIVPVLNTPEEIAEWSAHTRRSGTTLEAALQIETGMNRAGLDPAQTSELAANATAALKGLDLLLIMSHLACADEPDHSLNRK